ncbi:MAG: DUF512 domain-containing protein [Clostridiales bacterium]|jgi:putative radical SAM enzyme (TIGR03279 family)|nr:DUF512 domain-containing protein [Clostridiales bacterium]
MPKIIGFEKESILKKYGFLKGDDITAFDGFEYTDYLDYIFFDAKDSFSITALRENESITKRIIKKEGQSMGVELDDGGIEPDVCRNKCIFCFVDQMKKGMRETLYVKDDDYRLSVISGNYITLTNLSRADIERIKRLKLSPLYVSVHAYDKAVRCKMLCNRFAGKLFDILKELADAGISFHTQIVLVEGVNDGKVLRETAENLYAMYPSVLSVAVVPVGLTKYREGLSALEPLSVQCVGATIDFAEKFAEKAQKESGTAFVWCSDEMYIKSGKPVPPIEYYEDFCQIENGVGAVSRFVGDAKAYEPFGDGGEPPVSALCKDIVKAELITGYSFYRTMTELAEFFESKADNLRLKVTRIVNNFFGENVTVAGLITGTDIAAQFKPDADSDYVLIPKVMMRENCDVFLDGMTLAELETILGKPIIPSPSDGYEFAELLYGLRRA